MTLNDYFDGIFVINLDRSMDRWEHAQGELSKHGIAATKFPGVDWADYQQYPANLRSGMANAMYGCTASHGKVLSYIASSFRSRLDLRFLILEDDFEIFNEDFQDRFSKQIQFVPADWDILYLGAGYAETPPARINEHVIRAGCMKTTSSYAVTSRAARIIAPLMCGGSAPDDILSGWNPVLKSYVMEPRLMGQYENRSVIWGQVTHNSQSMWDPGHVEALDRALALADQKDKSCPAEGIPNPDYEKASHEVYYAVQEPSKPNQP